MKKVLITGANSYIGGRITEYLLKESNDYVVDVLDMLDDNWMNYSFKSYNTIFHVAGIAHSDNGNISEDKAKLYYRVNTDLAVKVAKKALKDGVNQFIFMSSMIVYGLSSKIGEENNITFESIPKPLNAYGDSKLQAEIGLIRLIDNEDIATDNVYLDNKKENICLNTKSLNEKIQNFDKMKICILRPPMIYGENSKGNYKILEKIAKKVTFFPYIKNKRSMLDVKRLCIVIKKCIDEYKSGIYFPQDENYHNTSEMVQEIAKENGRNVILVPGFASLFSLMGEFIPQINKAFGSLTYDFSMSKGLI